MSAVGLNAQGASDSDIIGIKGGRFFQSGDSGSKGRVHFGVVCQGVLAIGHGLQGGVDSLEPRDIGRHFN